MLIESEIKDAFSFYKKLRQKERHTALLESLGECIPGCSCYSFIGASARKALTVRNGVATLLDLKNGTAENLTDWKSVLDEWAPLGNTNNSTPYQTGCIGYIGYERKEDFERIQSRIPFSSPIEDVFLVLYDAVLVVERDKNKATWVIDDESLLAEIASYENLAKSGGNPRSDSKFALCGDVEFDTNEEEYCSRIERIIEYIKAGDVFQVNFTSRFRGKYKGDVIHLYESLRENTPNPYFALLDFPHPVISTSPERFLKIESGRIYASPIKGTLRCEVDGKDTRDILENSEKNRAENVMIADLMRNDIGRFCKQGSVRVDELCSIRRFNQLYHLESTISGTLNNNVSMSTVLASTFPCGSITGAPKIRAMEIIEELEKHRRGPYCGAIGFFGRQGWMNTCVGIRVIYFDDDYLYFHAGGGIVVDSSPADEFTELKLKVESIKASIESFNVMNDVREKIDKIDDELFHVVGKRFQAIQEACKIKKEYGVPVVQQSRMNQMISGKKDTTRLANIPDSFVNDLYAVLTRHSMELERQATH